MCLISDLHIIWEFMCIITCPFLDDVNCSFVRETIKFKEVEKSQVGNFLC